MIFDTLEEQAFLQRWRENNE